MDGPADRLDHRAPGDRLGPCERERSPSRRFPDRGGVADPGPTALLEGVALFPAVADLPARNGAIIPRTKINRNQYGKSIT